MPKPQAYATNQLELEIINDGREAVIGIDEVGRGCWAGPVYVGAYVYRTSDQVFEGVRDSKLLSPLKREKYFSQITALPVEYYLAIGEVEMIDELGIGNTIKQLVWTVKEKFKHLNAYYLIDGQFGVDFGEDTKQIIKGDQKHYSIAVASILAKVTRDKLMQDLPESYQNWNFAQHKGYGTQNHSDCLSKYGICDLHRKSYAPIQFYISKGQKS